MHVRVGGCGNILWGISFLITFMIILTILFTFTLVKIFCQYTENCWENRPNVQGKENSSAQYAVKIVPHHAACMCKGLKFIKRRNLSKQGIVLLFLFLSDISLS